MRASASWGAALLGAAAVAVAWFVVESGGQRPLPAAGHETFDLGPGVGQIEVLNRLDRIERRLDAVARAVEARPVRDPDGPGLAGRAEAPPAPATEPGEAPTSPGDPKIADEVLDRALERMEARKYAQLSDEDLHREAGRLLNTQRDAEGAKRLLQRLLERELAPEQRSQALTTLGMVHRALQDYDASEEVLREVIRTDGVDSTSGTWAGYQLVWTLKSAGKPDSALVEADRFLRSSGLPDPLRPGFRWAGAMLAHETGDLERARRDLQALVDEYKDIPQHRHIVQDAERRLRQLR